MEEMMQRNVKRVEILAIELGNLYKDRSKCNDKVLLDRYAHDVDKIHAEINVRTVLEKLYVKKELNESNLILLNNFVIGIRLYQESKYLDGTDKDKCIFKAEKLINNIDNYDEAERKILIEAYGDYNLCISKLLELNNKKECIFSKIRKIGIK